jgi:hypothetical protein
MNTQDEQRLHPSMRVLADQALAKHEAETRRLLEGYKGDEKYPDDDEALDWDPDLDGPGDEGLDRR